MATASVQSSRSGAGVRDAPLYQQVVSALREEIVRGSYAVGTKLPTEGELCLRFGVSRHTVREALRQLRDDGLVSSRQGAGTTIERPAARQAYVHEVGDISDLIQCPPSVRFKVEDCMAVRADARLAALIGGEVGQPWQRLQGLRHNGDEPRPLCWSEVYLHTDFAGAARLVCKREGTVYELIEDLYAVKVGEVRQEVRALPVPTAFAAGLQVAPGSTVIQVVRTYTLTSGQVAEVAVNYYPADRFSMSMTLRRSR